MVMVPVTMRCVYGWPWRLTTIVNGATWALSTCDSLAMAPHTTQLYTVESHFSPWKWAQLRGTWLKRKAVVEFNGKDDRCWQQGVNKRAWLCGGLPQWRMEHCEQLQVTPQWWLVYIKIEHVRGKGFAPRTRLPKGDKRRHTYTLYICHKSERRTT